MSRSCSFAFTVASVLLCITVAANAIDFTKPCEEGKQWKDDCHTCHCSNGKPVCTRELCPSEQSFAPSVPTPLSGVVEGGKTTCEEGKQWKDDCHTCHCTNGKPVCTRELCPSCTPGEKWMEDCNNCICDNQGEPECSRRICGRPSKKNPLK